MEIWQLEENLESVYAMRRVIGLNEAFLVCHSFENWMEYKNISSSRAVSQEVLLQGPKLDLKL